MRILVFRILVLARGMGETRCEVNLISTQHLTLVKQSECIELVPAHGAN